MSVLQKVQRLVTIAEGLAPNQCGKSTLFRIAANEALRSAAELELPRYNDGASETALGDQECTLENTPGPESGNDMNATLTRLLKRPPRVI